MTTEVKNPNPARENWVWRKGAYYIIGGILAIAVIFGLATIDQVENWLSIVERAIPALGSIALIFAGTKTGPGSDEKVTHRDVEDAAAKASSTAVNSRVFEYMDQVNTKIEALTDRLGGPTAAATQDAEPAAPESGAGTYPTGG